MRHEPSGRLAAAGGGPTEPFLVDGAPAADALAPLTPEQRAASAMPSVSTDGVTLTSAEAVAPAPARAAPAWVDAVAQATGVPGPALQGYVDTTLALDREDSGCSLGWTTFAGTTASRSWRRRSPVSSGASSCRAMWASHT